MIKSEEYFKKGILFDGLEHGKMHPTDIDAMVELKGKAYYFVELKREGNDIRTGQKILFERLCDDLYKAGKEAYAILAHHDWLCEDYNGDIRLKDCVIDKVYYPESRAWVEAAQIMTVKQFDQMIFERYGNGE